MGFSGSEIVELGIQIEKNGKDFYDTLAAQTKNIKARKLFLHLADEEKKHIIAFKDLLNSVQKYEPKQAYPEEYFSYMNALASDYIFTQKDKGVEAARQTSNDREAIGIGMEFEKKSVVFYEGMKKFVPEYDYRILDELIRQEKEHIQKLYDLSALIGIEDKL